MRSPAFELDNRGKRSITLVSGITAALFDRQRSGQGAIVETSLLKLGIYAASADYSLRMAFERVRKPMRRADSESPLVNSYKTSDDKCLWLLCVEANRHWPALTAALGHKELCDDERFKSTRSRHKYRQELIKTLDDIFATKTREQWASILDQHEIWWAPVNTLEEVLDNEQAKDIHAFFELPAKGDQKPMKTVASPIDFNRQPTFAQGPCPSLGEHTQDILDELNTQDSKHTEK